jgi:hypothetical protein
MSANRTPSGPRRAQSARVLARSTRNDSPKPMQPLPADASVRSAKCAFDDPSPTLRLAHRRSSLARGGGTGLWSHTATYEPTTGRDATERPAPADPAPRPRPAGPPPAPAEKREFTTLFAVDIRFVLGLCKSLLFVRSARGSAGRSGIPRMARLTNAAECDVDRSRPRYRCPLAAIANAAQERRAIRDSKGDVLGSVREVDG